MSASLSQLVHQLSARFNNQQQAFDNPPLYAHIVVNCRPLVHLLPGSLLIEQSYAMDPLKPYRIRVLRAQTRDEKLIIFSYSLSDEQKYWGSVYEPERMLKIEEKDLQAIEGCNYIVRKKNSNFIGEVEPGCRCLVDRKGVTTYIVSKFELTNKGEMRTLDRGHNPVTHEQLWGSLGGVFEFNRTTDFSKEIPYDWIEEWKK
uniref:Chromophore lyase CpcT/CpeT n=1 Tax=Paulinella chromatophora TaxID=39717 RepID=CPXT_PAUCH|nr:hypothetical protein PCC_0629 [Paulinella chromatophora]B1X536.1 RecName: Full=Chromophore lyase CpcT/CpeT [Paulinella chromatophora]ACB43055.1 hypothetical protein PCC_0629 [Paulinella chromatophora]